MRASILSVVLFLALLVVCNGVEGNKYKEPVTSTYTATLDAGQVVDGSDSGATGTGQFFYDAKTKTLSWTITHNVNNPLTADIHGPAPPGKNAKGDAVVALPSATSPIQGKAKLSTDEALDLMDDLLYVIIHTANNPLGEIRGQIILASIEGLAKGKAKLTGDKVVPDAVTTSATGDFSFSFSNLTRVMTYRLSHNVKNATAIHIHGPASETENAGVLLTFPETNDNKLKGNFTLTAQQEGFLLNTLLYVAIHSTNNPNGEIRGQVEVTEITLSTGESANNSGLSGGEIFAIIFFVFVGLLIAAGVGYFIYKKRADSSPSSSSAPASNFYNSSASNAGYRRQMGVSLLDDAQQV